MHLLIVLLALAPYQAFVEDGRVLRYFTLEWSHDSHGGLVLPTPRIATCTTSTLEQVRGARLFEVRCDEVEGVGGFWVATERGLHHLGHHRPRSKRAMWSALGPRTLVMPARPRERTAPPVREDGAPQESLAIDHPGKWCSTRDYSDVREWVARTTCFEGGLLTSVRVAVTVSDDGYWVQGKAAFLLTP